MVRCMVIPPDTLTDELRDALLARGAKLEQNQNGVNLLWVPLSWVKQIDCGFSDGVSVVILDDELQFEI